MFTPSYIVDPISEVPRGKVNCNPCIVQLVVCIQQYALNFAFIVNLFVLSMAMLEAADSK
jgi:hypothetical protein